MNGSESGHNFQVPQIQALSGPPSNHMIRRRKLVRRNRLKNKTANESRKTLSAVNICLRISHAFQCSLISLTSVLGC